MSQVIFQTTSKDGNDRMLEQPEEKEIHIAIDFHEGNTINEAALKALMLEAVGLNKSQANEPSFYESLHLR